MTTAFVPPMLHIPAVTDKTLRAAAEAVSGSEAGRPIGASVGR